MRRPLNANVKPHGNGVRLLILCAVAVGLVLSSSCEAVCLLDDYSVAAELRRSDAVVIATAASERRLPDPEDPVGFSGTIYSVEILAPLWGAFRGTIDVYSENSSGRFPLEKGKAYLLFLHRAEGRLSADNCGNSGPLEDRRKALAEVRRLAKNNVK